MTAQGPGLRRLDRWLLLHHPATWAMKTHRVAVWAAIGIAGAVVLGALWPVSITRASTLTAHTYVVLVLLVLAAEGCVIWIDRSQSPPPLRLGGRGWTGPLLAAMPFLALVAMAYLHLAVLHARVHRSVGGGADPEETFSRDLEMLTSIVIPAKSGGLLVCLVPEGNCAGIRLEPEVYSWEENRPPTWTEYDRADPDHREEWLRTVSKYSGASEAQVRVEVEALQASLSEVFAGSMLDSIDAVIAERRAAGITDPNLPNRVRWSAANAVANRGMRELSPYMRPTDRSRLQESSIRRGWGNVDAMGFHLSPIRPVLGEVLDPEAAAYPRFWIPAVLMALFLGLFHDLSRSASAAYPSLARATVPTATLAVVSLSMVGTGLLLEGIGAGDLRFGSLTFRLGSLPVLLPYSLLCVAALGVRSIPKGRAAGAREVILGAAALLTPVAILLFWREALFSLNPPPVPPAVFVTKAEEIQATMPKGVSWSFFWLVVVTYVGTLPIMWRITNEVLATPSP